MVASPSGRRLDAGDYGVRGSALKGLRRTEFKIGGLAAMTTAERIARQF
jgi:hypothetical protein